MDKLLCFGTLLVGLSLSGPALAQTYDNLPVPADSANCRAIAGQTEIDGTMQQIVGRSYKARMAACSCTRSRPTRIPTPGIGDRLCSSAWVRVSSLSIVSITSVTLIISIRWITTTSVCDLGRAFTADHSPAAACTGSARCTGSVACTGSARCTGPVECDGTSPTFSIRTSHLRWPKGAPQERIA